MGAIVGNSFWFDFEVVLMEFLQRILGGAGISIISFFSAFGEEAILALILLFLFLCYDKKKGIYLMCTLLVGLIWCPMIKNIFWRRRPYFDHEAIKCYRIVDKNADQYDIAAQGFSFPSGHSTNAAIAYGSLARLYKKRIFTILAFVIPFLVGFSRVVVGCHYPTDVLVGWLSGALLIFVIPKILDKVGEEKRWIVFLAIFLISCIGLLYCKTTDYFTGLGLMGGFFLAIEFDKRFVNFKNTKKPLYWVTRLFGSLAVYLILNTLLKLPFSHEFLESGTFLAGIVRCLRYIIVSFITAGVYPLLFRFEKNQ